MVSLVVAMHQKEGLGCTDGRHGCPETRDAQGEVSEVKVGPNSGRDAGSFTSGAGAISAQHST